jgi:peptidoglycan-associated lipoprotein
MRFKISKHFTATLIFVFIFLQSIVVAQDRRIQSADEDFANMRYSMAIPKYKKAYSRVKKNNLERDRITFQLAECYRFTNQPKRAEAFYKRLVRTDYDRNEPIVLLRLAETQHANGKYEDAIETYSLYAEKVPQDPRGNIGLEGCKLAEEWLDNPSNFDIQKLRKLNAREDDFAPAYSDPTGNAIIFTSARDGSKGKNMDEWTGMGFTDLYYARQDQKGDWSTPDLADNTGEVNSEDNEGTPAFNANFSQMYFTRCSRENETVNGCQIYVSRKQGRGWGTPEKVDLGGDSTSVFGHPAVSPDENFLVFSSPRKGGAGGKDLWIVSKSEGSSTFSSPRNLGENINTRGDEVFPSLRGDSVLYFASNGHPGMGGLDIFKSVRQEDGSWGDPINLRPPLNSNFDDFGISWHPNGLEQGYFSSNRRGSRGGDDIWFFINPPKLYTVVGKIIDNNTLQPVEDAEINLVSSDGTTVSTRSNTVGYYEFTNEQVKPNSTFEIFVNKENYFNEKAMETTVGLEASKDFTMDFRIEPIPAEPIVLPEILYDLGRWELKPQFQDSLQGLITTLDLNETIVVEIAAHTDQRGTEESNDILSQRRAQSVVDYLILRGIDPERMIARGYGERIPFAVKNDIERGNHDFEEGTLLTEEFIAALPGEEAKEAAHQMNRRTEFSIISKDFVPKPKIRTEVDDLQVDIVIDPKEYILDYTLTPNRLIQAPCIINAITLNFVYDRRTIRPLISLGSALRLLRDGAITKNDFVGDPDQILGEATIANRAVFVAKTLRIGGVTLNDVEIQVDHQLKSQMMIGDVTLSELGSFEINEEKQQIIIRTF